MKIYRTQHLRAALILLAAIATFAASGSVSAATRFNPVIELFTSQGCSSCPPADALLGELAKRDDVLALSLPVDVWDYLGWKDTLASPANSARQRAYARAQGERGIYTPQIVVNGILHAAGNNRASVTEALDAAAARLQEAWVPVSIVSKGDDRLQVQAGAANEAGRYDSGTLWLVLYSKVEQVRISRGENAGKTLLYHNVVREMSPIGIWNGKALSLDLPENDVMSRGYDGCAVLLQAGAAGPIIGAANLAGW